MDIDDEIAKMISDTPVDGTQRFRGRTLTFVMSPDEQHYALGPSRKKIPLDNIVFLSEEQFEAGKDNLPKLLESGTVYEGQRGYVVYCSLSDGPEPQFSRAVRL